jgi:hypothetical protein
MMRCYGREDVSVGLAAVDMLNDGCQQRQNNPS